MCPIGNATNFVVAPYKPFVNLRNDIVGIVTCLEDNGKSYAKILEILYCDYNLSDSLKAELLSLLA